MTKDVHTAGQVRLIAIGLGVGTLLGVAVLGLNSVIVGDPAPPQIAAEALPIAVSPAPADFQPRYPVETNPNAASAERNPAVGQSLSLNEMMALQEIAEASGGSTRRTSGYGYDSRADASAGRRSVPASPSVYPGYNGQSVDRSATTSGYEGASREWLRRNDSGPGTSSIEVARTTGAMGPSQSTSGALNARTGEYYPSAGTGYVSSRDGIYYSPSGPTGVINTRTGEYVPVTP